MCLLDVDLDLDRRTRRGGRSRIKVRCSARGADIYTTAITDACPGTHGIENDAAALMGPCVIDAKALASSTQAIPKYCVSILGKLDVFIRVVDEAVEVCLNRHKILFLF